MQIAFQIFVSEKIHISFFYMIWVAHKSGNKTKPIIEKKGNLLQNTPFIEETRKSCMQKKL